MSQTTKDLRKEVEKLVIEFHFTYPDKAGRHPELIINDLLALISTEKEEAYRGAEKIVKEVRKGTLYKSTEVLLDRALAKLKSERGDTE